MQPEAYAQFTARLQQTLAADPRVIGFIAAGSMAAIDRQPDDFSDHDFFVITQPGEQEGFRQDLTWLPDHKHIVLSIRETTHGLKVIYDYAHLIEFAVFDAEELTYAKVNDYRVLIDKADVATRIQSQIYTPPDSYDPTRDVAMVMALLYVGAGRYKRGEHLSAHVFIKQYALSHLLTVCSQLIPTADKRRLDTLDPFRRFETVYPALGQTINAGLLLPPLEAAAALLDVLNTHIQPLVDDYPMPAATLVARYIGGDK